MRIAPLANSLQGKVCPDNNLQKDKKLLLFVPIERGVTIFPSPLNSIIEDSMVELTPLYQPCRLDTHLHIRHYLHSSELIKAKIGQSAKR